MSLFNAKLLYTNKLLMNSDLSQTQRAQAIETLDDAASLREVKLLFKTLTEYKYTIKNLDFKFDVGLLKADIEKKTKKIL